MPVRQYKWGTVIIACMAIFIIVLDSSAMDVAITSLVGELNTSLSVIQAIMTLCAYCHFFYVVEQQTSEYCG